MSLSGDSKTRLSMGQLTVLGFMAGAYLAFATTLAVVTSGGVEPLGIKKLIMGAVFPIGLIAIVIGGAELYTGNVMTAPVAAMTGRTSWGRVAYNWTVVYMGNFLGAFFVAYLIIRFTHILPATFISDLQGIAVAKVSHPWWENFWRGFGCVWLVDLAIYLASRVKEPVAKFFVVWFPAMAFFAIGFEHSIVNMFVIPAGILAGAPISWSQFLWSNLAPVTLGNTVAGLFMMGMLYWYVAGMPLLKPAGVSVTPSDQHAHPDYISAGNSHLLKVLMMGSALSIAFTAFLPGVAGLIAFAVTTAGSPTGGSVFAAAPSLAAIAPFLIGGYFIAVAVMATIAVRKR
ncbi:MAG: formate/nitrite transporter family protein [Dehalococcoidia bacterium]